MNAIDSAIMASLTCSNTLNGIISNTPELANDRRFIEVLLSKMPSKETIEWNGGPRSRELVASIANKPGITLAMQKARLFSMLNREYEIDPALSFFLAIERMAAEPDGENADIWLRIAAVSMPLINTESVDCEPCEMPF